MSRMNVMTAAIVSGAMLAAGVARADNFVVAGSDYFQTQPGTQFAFGPPIGLVSFISDPIGPGATDTIIERLGNEDLNNPTAVPLEVMALSLESAAPVNVGGMLFNVFVTLDPANLANDTGTITIDGSPSGGTFSSLFNVYFQASFVQQGNPSNTFVVDGHTVLSQDGDPWQPTPVADEELVTGPVGDLAANDDTNLAANQFDFFSTDPTDSSFLLMSGCGANPSMPGCAKHLVREAPRQVVVTTAPEPASLALWISGLAGLWLARRTRNGRRPTA
jgi:hypothetical protein